MQRDIPAQICEARLQVYDGNIAAASSIISDIRSSVDISRELWLAGEVQIIEGLILVGKSAWSSSIDRFRRGVVIGRMIPSSDISVFAEVWLSHGLLRIGRELEAIEILSRIDSDILQSRLEARHRYCAVAAELCAIGGDRQRCEDWFEVSRRLAGQIESRGLFSASLFNLCMLRVWQSALLPRLQGKLEESRLRSDLLLLESSINYDNLADISDRRFLHELLRGQLLAMLGNIEDARSIFRSLLDGRVMIGELEIHRIQLELIWCSLEDQSDAALISDSCDLLQSSISILIDEDDLALAYSLLAKCSLLLGDGEKSQQAQNEANRLLGVLRDKQDLIGCRIASLRVLA